MTKVPINTLFLTQNQNSYDHDIIDYHMTLTHKLNWSWLTLQVQHDEVSMMQIQIIYCINTVTCQVGLFWQGIYNNQQ